MAGRSSTPKSVAEIGLENLRAAYLQAQQHLDVERRQEVAGAFDPVGTQSETDALIAHLIEMDIDPDWLGTLLA